MFNGKRPMGFRHPDSEKVSLTTLSFPLAHCHKIQYLQLTLDTISLINIIASNLFRAITPKTKMLILNSPHNPTGKVTHNLSVHNN